MKEIILPNGTVLPNLGLGTWFMGEDYRSRQEEIQVLQEGIRRGIRVLDTAEMYGNGAAEELIGLALRGLSEEEKKDLFIVSKVLPSHADKKRMKKSCEQSLKRMGLEALDLYLLHWRGYVPLEETVDGLEELVQEGKIKAWGVSNLDTPDMEELLAVRNGENCQVNQVLYHLGSRGIEFDLKPFLDNHNIPVMAYCPLAQGGRLKRKLLEDGALAAMAEAHNCSTIQLLLAFVLAQPQVLAIPKVSRLAHLKEILQAQDIILSAEELQQLNALYPAPLHKTYLDIV